MRDALLLAVALAGPAAAQDRCLVACDEVAVGTEAAARAPAALGVDLPAGATVVGLVQGGFQDAYLQARIEVADGILTDVLEAFDVDPAALRADGALNLGPTGPGWWEEARQGRMRAAIARLPGFDHAAVAVAKGEGSAWTLLLWAVQT